MADRFSSVLEALRGALRHERLPPPSSVGPAADTRPGVLQLIFAPERLGQDPAAPATTDRGLLGLLFAIEPLDQAPPVQAPPPSRWLAWLIRPEHLDD
jgi:hypothetical protein